jgi:DNA polymerase-1
MYTDISTPDLEQDSMKHQLMKLVGYLECLPLTTMSIDHIEADDTIGYLASEIFTDKDSTVTIMSSDKDFIQLVDDRVKVWSPTKKKLYGPEEVSSEFGISSKNFIHYRIMDGDKSDNIPGVKGAGLKTILKAFPMLKEESKVSLEEIQKYAESNINGLKIYESVVNNKDLMERNEKLMQLEAVDISGSTKTRIMDIIDKPVPELNKMKFTQLLSEDKMFGAIENHLVWMGESFGVLDMISKNNKK